MSARRRPSRARSQRGGSGAHRLRRSSCPTRTICILRPGRRGGASDMGGLHKFMTWDGPILTDSGGFQVFSLARPAQDHGGGRDLRLPSGRPQNLHGTRRRACASSPTSARISRWRLTSAWKIPATYDICEGLAVSARNDGWRAARRSLIGYNSRAGHSQSRSAALWHQSGRALSRICASGTCRRLQSSICAGYAIGGLAVGEPTEVMYDIIEAVEPYMPKDKPRYLMGVGTPANIIEGVARGVDFFDCVMPARNARHGKLFTWQGAHQHQKRQSISWMTTAPLTRSATARSAGVIRRAYIRHLFKAEEMLAMRLGGDAQPVFLQQADREDPGCHWTKGRFREFRAEYSRKLDEKI